MKGCIVESIAGPEQPPSCMVADPRCFGTWSLRGGERGIAVALEYIRVRDVELRGVHVGAEVGRAGVCASRLEEREIERVVPVSSGEVQARADGIRDRHVGDGSRQRWATDGICVAWVIDSLGESRAVVVQVVEQAVAGLVIDWSCPDRGHTRCWRLTGHKSGASVLLPVDDILPRGLLQSRSREREGAGEERSEEGDKEHMGDGGCDHSWKAVQVEVLG